MNSTFTNNAMYDLLVKHLKLKVKVAMSQTALELTVQLKTGDSKQFTKSCDTNNTSVTLNSLRQNCVTLQKEVNDFLTTLVEEERSVSNVNNESKTNGGLNIYTVNKSKFYVYYNHFYVRRWNNFKHLFFRFDGR